MHGNVFEWCADWRGAYPAETVTDPAGPPSGVGRVVRGGSWDHDAFSARSAFRVAWHPGGGLRWFGFRLVRLAPRGR